MEELEIKDFLNLARTIPIIDVRSPGEYFNGHIPLSFNIPLFEDQERATIGICYKQQGKKEAISQGLEIVGPKMASFVRRANNIAVDNQVLVHCWRGGMRSSSFSWLLNTAGIKSYTLIGGYKSYRNFAIDLFANLNNLVLLGGETGSGKTELLAELHKAGEQVVDLEALAQHKGSSFGGFTGTYQPTNEQFENNLVHQLMGKDLSRRIWLEDESHNIGAVRIPDGLWFNMRTSPVVRLVISKEERLLRLLQNYGSLDKEFLAQGIIRIKKKLGGLNTSQALDSLKSDNLMEVANICLNYYDKAYKTGLNYREPNLINNLEVNNGYGTADLVNNIIGLANQIDDIRKVRL